MVSGAGDFENNSEPSDKIWNNHNLIGHIPFHPLPENFDRSTSAVPVDQISRAPPKIRSPNSQKNLSLKCKLNGRMNRNANKDKNLENGIDFTVYGVKVKNQGYELEFLFCIY